MEVLAPMCLPGDPELWTRFHGTRTRSRYLILIKPLDLSLPEFSVGTKLYVYGVCVCARTRTFIREKERMNV